MQCLIGPVSRFLFRFKLRYMLFFTRFPYKIAKQKPQARMHFKLLLLTLCSYRFQNRRMYIVPRVFIYHCQMSPELNTVVFKPWLVPFLPLFTARQPDKRHLPLHAYLLARMYVIYPLSQNRNSPISRECSCQLLFFGNLLKTVGRVVGLTWGAEQSRAEQQWQ